MDSSDTDVASEAALPCVSSDAETTAVRIVSNFPAGPRGITNGVQAQRSAAVADELNEWSDEEDDEDLDMSELDEDLAEQEEELDHGAWDDLHGASLIYSTVHMYVG